MQKPLTSTQPVEVLMRSMSVAVMMVVASVATAAWAAESKPIHELPTDLAHWSTLWVEVPKQMYGVGQEDGPIAAMTWGPVRGTVMLVNATTKAVWDMAKPDRSRSQQPGGAILRYEF